jgi:hypothetical protein
LTVFAARSSGRVISGAEETIPSPYKNPAASSKSCPGVRMVTATGEPFSRISSGSSTATSSVRPSTETCFSTSGLSDKLALVCRAKVEHGGGRVKPE